MKHIIYQLDDDFNIINKFMFANVIVAYSYVQQHLSEEKNTNFLQLNLDENNDIQTVNTYRNGKKFKTLSHISKD